MNKSKETNTRCTMQSPAPGFRKYMRNRQVIHHKSAIGPHSSMSVPANRAAMRKLSANGYRLYMYFALNVTDFHVIINTEKLCEWAGMSTTTYRKAFRELEEHGYMHKAPGWKNAYHFYEEPTTKRDAKSSLKQKTEKRKSVQNMENKEGADGGIHHQCESA